MSVLVGFLIGLSRLAADSEITAMRASGTGVGNMGGVNAEAEPAYGRPYSLRTYPATAGVLFLKAG